MSKVLKRLYLGDVVKSFGAKQLRKLTTEKPQDDSIVGTWLFNDTLTETGWALLETDNTTISVDFNFECNGNEYTGITAKNYYDSSSFYHRSISFNGKSGLVYTFRYYRSSNNKNLYDHWYDDTYKTITIKSEPTDEAFITWLKANATKQ